jgi:aryl-alcohol dehydrogenase-like predicted oxidoreductase
MRGFPVSAPVIGPLLGQRLAFGVAGLSVAVPAAPEDARVVVHAALDAGVRLLDTAACYIPDHRSVGHNERLVADALRTWDGARDAVLVSTKGGITRLTTTEYAADLHTCGCRRCLLADCDASLRALEVEQIALYQLHAPDPRIPIEESVQTLADLQQHGKVRWIGLSNVSVDQLDRARAVAPIASVQNRLNPGDLTSLQVLRACEASGTAFLAYSPLGGLGGAARRLAARSKAFASIAAGRGTSTQSVMLAWARALSPVLTPVVGARRAETIRDSAHSAELYLTGKEFAALNAALLPAENPEGAPR